MSSSRIPTSHAVSPDSGEPWTAEGAWPVAAGVHRIPLPLPLDGLKAVNVYVLEADDGFLMVDGGWAIAEAQGVLERSLALLGAHVSDVKRFLVTHVHRDHYTMAAVMGDRWGAKVALGAGEKPCLDLLHAGDDAFQAVFRQGLVTAGAASLLEAWRDAATEVVKPEMWRYPDEWLHDGRSIKVGDRTLSATHTPGHTPGHFVFADRLDKLLFAGDHVLPTITPSIGYTTPPVENPLADFMGSLAKVRAMPDMRVLPAHGPVSNSSHQRVEELTHHHEHRLTQTLKVLDGGAATAYEVAHGLGWTRHERGFDDLDVFNQGLASKETLAHLELLAAQGNVTRQESQMGIVFARVPDGRDTAGGPP
jgi:glyoxylase-like metal-dependent hydrolase (beta-lactamase superfamily II)